MHTRNNSEAADMKMKKGLCAHQSNFMRSLLLRFNSLLVQASRQRRRCRCRCRRRSVGCLAQFRVGLPIISACSRPPHHPRAEDLPSGTRRRTQGPKLSPDDDGDPPPCRRRRRLPRRFFFRSDAIPSAQNEYDRFIALHPAYLDTLLVDELRQEEFSSLDSGHVFLDYSGHGLFSQLQRELDAASSSFILAPISVPMPLPTALRGCGVEDGTVESDVRRRIMRFLNVHDGEYGMVFAASKVGAFELLAESYEFDGRRSLLTVLDYESDAVRRLLDIASSRGAQLLSAKFDFPSLALRGADLKAQIVGSGGDPRATGENDCCDGGSSSSGVGDEFEAAEKGGSDGGEMTETAADTASEDIDSCCATGHGHGDRNAAVSSRGEQLVVMDDATAEQSDGDDGSAAAAAGGGRRGEEEKDDVDVGVAERCRGLFVFPVQSRVSGGKYSYQWMSLAQRHGWHVLLDASANDMSASLAFSLFRPDFIVASFYNVFGSDPTGFACLFVKHSAAAAALSATTAAAAASRIVRLVAPPDADAPPHPSGSAAAARHPPQVAFSGAVSSSAVPDSLVDAHVNRTRLSDRDAPLFPPPSPPSTCATPVSRPTPISILSCSPSVGKAVVRGAPLTPRSVLEDGLTHGHGYSNGACSVGESGSSSSSSLYRKGSSNIVDPVVLSVREAQKAKDRRRSRFWWSGRYSHNIGRARSPVPHNAHPASLSQPLDGQKKRDSLPEGDIRSRADDDDLEFSSSLYEDDDDDDDDGGEFSLTDDGDDGWRMMRRDPEIYCRGLNHADALGRSKTNERLRYLISWLVSSMQELRHRVSDGRYVPLVRVYGPGAAEHERGASMAFNVFDREGAMVSPAVVQAAAREDGIYVGAAELANLNNNNNRRQEEEEEERGRWTGKLAVVSASLGFFTNFQDVYRLWAFAAKFLDPSFYPLHNIETYVNA